MDHYFLLLYLTEMLNCVCELLEDYSHYAPLWSSDLQAQALVAESEGFPTLTGSLSRSTSFLLPESRSLTSPSISTGENLGPCPVLGLPPARIRITVIIVFASTEIRKMAEPGSERVGMTRHYKCTYLTQSQLQNINPSPLGTIFGLGYTVLQLNVSKRH